MPRRTLARQNLLTLASQPWTLYENDPGAGGGGGGGATPPAVNEHGYPDNTATAEMAPEHQIAYWKHHARKHETRANSAPDAAELERLRAAEAELATRKAAELSETERLQKERDDAAALAATNAATAAAATAELLRIKVAADKGLTVAQAARLQGSTKEELEADADALRAEWAPAGGTGQQQRHGGPRGSEVGGTSSVSTGAERYRERHGKN
ncbi:hypothetical protein [Streptomyces chryseus]|uniref:hypothetical protein n=1 Tax=Streptomyces chryseus TaxID=68186 RepID=UPI0016757477|nr:hypothetical protein [Streptomyces chryseus]GGX26991.1 hypothetical protein GCM10010353_47780 [Streptomyces chryseus]